MFEYLKTNRKPPKHWAEIEQGEPETTNQLFSQNIKNMRNGGHVMS